MMMMMMMMMMIMIKLGFLPFSPVLENPILHHWLVGWLSDFDWRHNSVLVLYCRFREYSSAYTSCHRWIRFFMDWQCQGSYWEVFSFQIFSEEKIIFVTWDVLYSIVYIQSNLWINVPHCGKTAQSWSL